MKPAIIVDIDGTVALSKPDRAEAEAANVNYRPWFEATLEQVLLDTPHVRIVDLLVMLSRTHALVFITGREERSWSATQAWLVRQGLWDNSCRLFCRKNGNTRDDVAVKEELYWAYVSPTYDVKYVFDDRRCCADMWRGLGLLCLDVAGNE